MKEMTAEEIIHGLAEEQGWNESVKAVLLTRFLNELGKEQPKILEKLNIFLGDVQNVENEIYTTSSPQVSDELYQFFENILTQGEDATLTDAQEVMSKTSPQMLGTLLEALLLEENSVKSLEELDLEAVYDDIAQELDSLENEYGLTKPLNYFLATEID